MGFSPVFPLSVSFVVVPFVVDLAVVCFVVFSFVVAFVVLFVDPSVVDSSVVAVGSAFGSFNASLNDDIVTAC